EEETLLVPHARCPYVEGTTHAAPRTYTIQRDDPRPLYLCPPCACFFPKPRHTPIAQLKTPIACVGQVLAALTEGVGLNAATRLYGVSKNSIYRWQERLSGLKKPCCCLR